MATSGTERMCRLRHSGEGGDASVWKAGGGGLNIVILDACRNSPLPSRRKTKGALSKGLARMDAPSETVIVYAAAPGRGRTTVRGTSVVHRCAVGADGPAGAAPGGRSGGDGRGGGARDGGDAAGRQEPWLEMKPMQRPFYFVPPPVEASDNDDGGVEVGARAAAGRRPAGRS